MVTKKPQTVRLNFSTTQQDPLSKKILAMDNSSYQSTTYISELGVSITTNEIVPKKIYRELSSSKAAKNSCHLGVSGWYNLDMIAIRRSERGIIFDSNPDVALFFDHTFRCIIDSADKETFIRNMKVRVEKYEYNLHNRSVISEQLLKYTFQHAPNLKYTMESDLSPAHEIDVHSQNPEGWLANQDRYEFIRGLVVNNKIVVLTEDITNLNVFQKIHKLLDDNNICVDTIYVSNVHSYIPEINKHNFLETISCLADENTLIIDSEFNLLMEHCLEQRITNYREIKSTEQQCERWFQKSLKNTNDKDISTHKGTFFNKSSEKEKTVCNYSVVFVMSLFVVLSAYFLNQSNKSEVAPKFQP